MPTARAASAPVNATWLSASPVKTWAAQHDEVARPRRQAAAIGVAGEERVLQERVGEDVHARPVPGQAGSDGHARAPAQAAAAAPAEQRARACAARYTANANVVTQNPIGYGE